MVVVAEYLGSEAAFVRGAAELTTSPPLCRLSVQQDAVPDTATLGVLLDTATNECCIYSANQGGSGDAWKSPDLVDWVYASALRMVDEVEFAPWSGLLVPAAVLAVVLVLDSGYWFGWEGCLLCCRPRDAGSRVMAVADAEILNHRRTGEYVSTERAYYSNRNQLLSFRDIDGTLMTRRNGRVLAHQLRWLAGAVMVGK